MYPQPIHIRQQRLFITYRKGDRSIFGRSYKSRRATHSLSETTFDSRTPSAVSRAILFLLLLQCRIVGLSASLANAKDVGDWIGATAHSLVSFRPDVRPVPLEIKLHGFDVNHFGSRMLAMAKPAYNYVAVGCAGE